MKKRFTYLLLFAFCAFFLSGCVTSKRVDKQIAKHYIAIPKDRRIVEPFEISTGQADMGDKISQSNSQTDKLLPLLVYWKEDRSIHSTINPKIPLDKFKKVFNANARRKIAPKLGDRQLEITVAKIPHQFSYKEKSHLIFGGFFWVAWERVWFESPDLGMLVSYKVSEDGREVKTGKIDIPGASDNAIPLKMFQNWKRAISNYLGVFDNQVAKTSKDVIPFKL